MIRALFLIICTAAAALAADVRIVSLAPATTRSLYELGLDSAVVGITTFCPPGTTAKTVIGTLWEPNIEKIAMLKPDLVIASKEGNKKSTAAALKNLGLKVMVLEAPRSFDEICATTRALGAALGRRQAADAVIAAARARLASVSARRAAHAGRLRVFWEVGDRPLFSVGAQSFMHEYNTYLCTENIFGGITAPYPQVSREEVLRRAPDVIFVIAMAGMSAREQREWDKYPAVPAVSNHRVFFVENQDFLAPTPLNFAAGTEYFEHLLDGTDK